MDKEQKKLTEKQKKKIWNIVSKLILKIIMTPGGGTYATNPERYSSDFTKEKPRNSFTNFDDYKKFVLEQCEICLNIDSDNPTDKLFYTIFPYAFYEDRDIYVNFQIKLDKIIFDED